MKQSNFESPRQMRDCTFQDWADPIERPAPKQSISMTAYVALLCVASVCVFVWGML